VGKVLYEASTGRDRTEFPTPPIDLDAEEATAWADFNEVLLRACAPIPTERYPDAPSMLGDLQLLRAGKSVRRLRTLERRQRLMTRLGGIAVLAGLVLTGALLRERFHARQLAALATENRTHAVRLHLAEAFRRIDDGDIPGSLPSLIAAWRRDSNDPQRAAIHQTRFAIVAQQCPQTVALGAHEGTITSGRFSSDGRWIVTASDDHTARVWSTDDGNPRYPPLHHPDVLLAAEFSHNDSRILTVSRDGTLSAWDAFSGAAVLSHLTGTSPLQCAAFSPDHTLVALGGEDGRVSVHRIGTSQATSGPKCAGPIHALAWIPDSTPRSALFLHVESGRLLGSGLPHLAGVMAVAYRSDGHQVATGGNDGVVRLWDPQTYQTMGRAMHHARGILHLEFSRDGRFLLSTSLDRTARLWDSSTGNPISAPIVHTDHLWKVQFTKDNQSWIAASGPLNASARTGHLKLYHFPRILPSPEQAESISSLIAGHRVKENGATEPIPTPEWVASFRRSTGTR